MGGLSAAMNEILAANVKHLRLTSGLKQELFAELIGVSQGTVSRWEGGAEPKGEQLVKLAAHAGRSVHELTTRLIAEDNGKALTPTFAYEGSTLMLPVHLPNSDVLTEMFSQILESLGEADPDVIARRLAQMLPGALAQTVARLPRHHRETLPPVSEDD
ncbi:helix-turn-helix transcriptional regulator [Rhizorhapis suberifaciens]|uniref:Transcriptional regulator with XRE-family HTH domain n=1 Tax=Rhizorhapis suberifaciens TaxID=13656 RepID=A0A840HXQ2_9SPHN|nr:helix-turn-helix domain-containing protein [Rhizorhapis suberifaciens]MBB4642340.1 transcriptional regulator with XRE-family HTH domain [Rhizorhapis suberifaciens]